jgi:NDP-sugar pyrophosphorylase family protein
MGSQYQAVLLAGGAGASLFPLNHTGLPLALFPVANQPLITYPLKALEDAGIHEVLVVRLL